MTIIREHLCQEHGLLSTISMTANNTFTWRWESAVTRAFLMSGEGYKNIDDAQDACKKARSRLIA